MSEIKFTNYILFLISALIIGYLFFASGDIAMMFGWPDYYDIIMKICIIIILCAYALKRGDLRSLFNVHFQWHYLLLIIIPVIFSIVLQNCPLDFEPYPSFILTTVLGTLTTAVWEELFFRYVGCSLFEENGKFRWYNIIFLALAFSIGHVFNGFADGWYATSCQIVFTVGLGVFTLGLYIHSKSIIAPIIAHFCINSVADYFNLYATSDARAMAYIGNLADPVLILDAIVLVILGFYILKKNKHII